MSTPLLSIGLPVYNGSDFLAETIESILEQSFTDFELIICDNASTDNTADIVNSYQAEDDRIRYFRNKTNLGAARNYNLCFEKARGRYFKWSAHDDLLAPTFFERCLAVLEDKPEVSICYSRVTIINENGEFRGYYDDNLDLRAPLAHKRLQDFFARPGMCHPIFGIMRREILNHTILIGNFPRSDRNLIGELILWGQVHEIPDRLFYRRIHPNISTMVNLTETQLAAWYDPRRANKRVFPRWRRFFEYVKAIHRAPLSRHERLRCYWTLLGFVTKVEKWRGLLNDLQVAIFRTNQPKVKEK